MKQTKFLFFFLLAAGGFAILQGCGDKRKPGRTYMPDMQYFRSYQAYHENNLAKDQVNYIPYPVEGTIRRGDLFPYTLPNDSTGYRLSAQVKNPLPTLTDAQMKEAGRLYNVYCGICHGEKMDAQGPLSAGGKVPAVANLTLKQYIDMPEGTMFHSITYGKGNMGSYASQLTREERWMVVDYVKSLQSGAVSAPATPAPAASDAEGAQAEGDGANQTNN